MDRSTDREEDTVESVAVSDGDCGDEVEGEDIEDTGEACDDGDGVDILGCDDLEVSVKDLVFASCTACGASGI
jgi:hypothetical protein